MLLLGFGFLWSLAVAVFGAPPHAFYADVVRGNDGKPVAGAQVLVTHAGTDEKAAIFRGESAGTTKSAFLLELSKAPVDSSSIGWNLSPRQAFDGNTGTRWSSVPGLPPVGRPTRKNEWLWVDCGADVKLRSLWIDFQDSAAVDYSIHILTEEEGAALKLARNGEAGGGVDKWTTIATAKNLPNGLKSPNRKRPGVRDQWDFVNGTAVIPDREGGNATVNVEQPTGRYLLINTTRASDPGYGNVSIWEITVETEWQDQGAPMKNVLFTTDTDNFVPQANPLTTDEKGRFRFHAANGDYDLHISSSNGLKYSLTEVALVNPTRPHEIHAAPGETPLTLVQRGEKTSGGNNALSLGRPGSTDANNPPTPYRMFVNKGKQAWALTLNADWDEMTNKWMPRRIRNQSFVFRINGEDHSLEYGNDSFTNHNPPVMETLFRISKEGEIWTKSYGGYHGLAMEVRNKTGRQLHVGNVVVLDPSSPFSVILPRRRADLNPAVIYKTDGARVFILVAGRMTPHMGSGAQPGDFLVTEGAGSVRAVVGSKAVDPRAILGTVSDRNLLTIVR